MPCCVGRSHNAVTQYSTCVIIEGKHYQVGERCHSKCTQGIIEKVPRGIQAKEKYRGVFEIQWSGDKTSSGEIGLDIRTHASPKVGQDQVSGGVSVLCWHAAPVAYVLWKPCTIR